MNTAKILVLENQMIIAADISLQLNKLGYEVIGMTADAGLCLQIIGKSCPDIVLMNVNLHSDTERIKIAGDIRKTFGIPVILMSAHTDRKILHQLIDAQPYAFLPKPFTVKALQRAITTTLDRMTWEGLRATYISDSVPMQQENDSAALSFDRSEVKGYHSDNRIQSFG